MVKKLLLLFFCCLTAALSFALTTSGNCGKDGDNLMWSFNIATGTLTISGKGEMEDYNFYSQYNRTPWEDLLQRLIEHVEIENGVTSIGEYAFYYYYGSSLTSVTIPNSITSIGANAFALCSNLTSVTIPNSVKNIGTSAFARCDALETVTIPNGVENIGAAAFYNCVGLASIDIPNSVKCIGSSAFFRCTSLVSVIIPNSVKSIEQTTFFDCTSLTFATIGNSVERIEGAAFMGCNSLASITIPDNVTSIEANAFFGCNSLITIIIGNGLTDIAGFSFPNYFNLTSIDVAADNPDFASKEGVLFNKAETMLIRFPSKKPATSYTIPGSVESIKEAAFINCSYLVTVTIPNSVKCIGSQAFISCGLTSISIPGSVESIGSSAFGYCKDLASIKVESANPSYSSEDGVLFNKAKTTLIQYPIGRFDSDYTIPGSVTNIEANAFAYCDSLVSIDVPNSVTDIRDGAFAYCDSLASIDIPNSVTDIGINAFAYCFNLTSITIGSNVKSIGPQAFWGCAGLVSVIIPNSVTSIGSAAFSGCTNLKSIIIGNNVTNIGHSAFSGCIITSITIPSSVESIDVSAFSYCNKLTSVTNLSATPQEIDTTVFKDVTLSAATLYVPLGAKAAYQDAPVWQDFGHIVEIEETPPAITVFSYSATIIWTKTEGAVTYTLVIYKDASHTEEAARFQLDLNGVILRTIGNLSCTVSNLNPATTYYYSITSYDNQELPLTVFNGDFKTKGDIGIDEPVATEPVSIYPNPASEYFYIGGIEETIPITVLDVSGQIVLQSVVAPEEPVSVAHLPQGTYIVRGAGRVVKLIKK